MSQNYYSCSSNHVTRYPWDIERAVQIPPGAQDTHSHLLSHPGPSGPFPAIWYSYDPLRACFVARSLSDPLNIPAHSRVKNIKEMNGGWNKVDDEREQQGEDEMYDDEEQEEQEVSSELDDPEAGSRWYTPPTTVSDSTSVTAASDEGRTCWVHDPTLDLVILEQLRGSFESELKSPSAWVIQRFAVLTGASSDSGLQDIVKLWRDEVACLTSTPKGEPLQLPPVTLLKGSPFYKILSWEKGGPLIGKDQKWYFREEVGEKYKQAARLSIEFLFPEAKTLGLLAIEKERILTVALTVWDYDIPRALGLLWVLEEEYFNTRPYSTRKWMNKLAREWMNEHSKEFMVYTVFYPPPIAIVHPASPVS